MIQLHRMEKKKKIIIWPIILFLAVWALFVLYPNPYRLGVSVYRVLYPAINPEAVKDLVERAPGDPREIEAFVLENIPYQYDWQTYGVPFYFPRAEEVVANGTGDCKSRFVVLASIFEAKGIPYEQSFSLSHFWIHYEGKEETAVESSQNAFLRRSEEGVKIQFPREDLKDTLEVLSEGFWEAMPLHRKILLLAGIPLSLVVGFVINKKRNERLEPRRIKLPSKI